MVAGRLSPFGGMLPARDDTLLPDNAAAHSENTWLTNGLLRGIAAPELIRACASGTTKVYRIPNSSAVNPDQIGDSTWLEFADSYTDVLRAPIVDDTFQRYYWVSPSEAPSYNTLARIQAGDTGNDAFTKILLHFDGVDASTVIHDHNDGGASHTWTASGNAQIDTAQSKFGGESLLLDGTGDYVSTPDHADFTLGSGSWSVDFQFRCNVAGGTLEYLFGQCNSTPTNATTSILGFRSTGNVIVMRACVGTTAFDVTGTTQFTDAVNTGWHHLEFTRTGNILRMFIDGVQQGGDVAITGTVNDSANAFSVGRAGEVTTDPWTGWIDEFRLSVGTARHTANFTAPTAAYDHGDAYLLGIPVPGSVTVTPSGGVAATTVTRAYAVTWESAYGEEGAPSVSTATTGKTDDTWTVTLPAPSGGDLGVNRNLTTANIYRTVTSTLGVATYFFVASVDIQTTSYADTASDTTVSANSQLESTTWSAPPTGLEGWVQMGNGMIVGWKANELHFCEPYRPHAWPASYSLAVEYPIVGLGVANQTLVVATEGFPMTGAGVRPASFTLSKVPSLEPCTSRGSIASSPTGVFYTSPNGLIAVAQGAAVNTTRQLVTRDRWQRVGPLHTMRAAWLGTAYYAYGTTLPGVFQTDTFQTDTFQQLDFTGSFNGILVDPTDERIAFNELSTTDETTNVFPDFWSAEVFIIRNNNLYRINLADDTPTRTAYLWRSKKFQTRDKGNLGCLRLYFTVPENTPSQNPVRNTNTVQTLQSDQYGLLRIYADDSLVMTREIRSSGELMRLPFNGRADFWQIEVEGRVDVKSIQFASTPKELAKV